MVPWPAVVSSSTVTSRSGSSAKMLIQRAGDAATPFVNAGAHVRTGVGHEPGYAKLGAALQLIAKRGDRALPERVVRGSQVDQIRIMRDDEADLARVDPSAEALCRLGRDRLSVPLVRVLGENLARRHAERRGAFDSQRMTAGDRHMRPQQPHRLILHHSTFPARGHGDHTTDLDSPCQRPPALASYARTAASPRAKGDPASEPGALGEGHFSAMVDSPPRG